MSDFRFGIDDYGLDYHPHEGVCDEQECIDWSKVEYVEIDWVTFVRERTCELLEEHVGMLDPWPYHLKCSSCGAVFDYFDCYCKTGRIGLTMRYCRQCGAKVVSA